MNIRIPRSLAACSVDRMGSYSCHGRLTTSREYMIGSPLLSGPSATACGSYFIGSSAEPPSCEVTAIAVDSLAPTSLVDIVVWVSVLGSDIGPKKMVFNMKAGQNRF